MALSPTETWLNSLVKDPEVINSCDPYTCRLAQRKTVSTDIDFYYTPNDSDIKNSDQDWVDLLAPDTTDPKAITLKSYIETYNSKQILIKPNTNRFHANYIFKQLVDYCLVNKLTYPYDNISNKLLVEPDLKTEFYKFCKKYS
jgi:hypothetical protein